MNKERKAQINEKNKKKFWGENRTHFTRHIITHLATMIKCRLAVQVFRPRYHQHQKWGLVYMNLTFTNGSSVTFSPTTTEIELLAVLPTWQGSVASPGSLAPQLSPTGWESGRVDGSVAWLLAAPLPSWPGERAGMGSPVSRCIDRGPALH